MEYPTYVFVEMPIIAKSESFCIVYITLGAISLITLTVKSLCTKVGVPNEAIETTKK